MSNSPRVNLKELYGFDTQEEAQAPTPTAATDESPTLPDDPLRPLAIAHGFIRPHEGFISRVCDACGQRYTIRHPRQLYCTTSCARRAMRYRKRLHDEEVRRKQLLSIREGQQHQD